MASYVTAKSAKKISNIKDISETGPERKSENTEKI